MGYKTKPPFVMPAWVNTSGPSDDVAISTRARLARNITDSPFPTRARKADLKRVADLVLDTIYNADERVDKLRIIYPPHLSDSERLALVNSRLASSQQVKGGRYCPVLLNDAGTLSIMVNEEDHLRIQSILPGLQPLSALQMAQEFDNAIGVKIRYAQTDNYGYLTSSLANIGTGFRVSVMLHLAGLTYLEEAVDVLTAAARLKISVRGLFGEGTKAFGDIFQVSNETTMGFTEKEITSRVRAAAEHLVSRERAARRKLAAESKAELAEIMEEIHVRLQASTALSGREAMAYLSMLRLGSEIGLGPELTAKQFNEMLVSMQLSISDSAVSAQQAAGTLRSDIKRAKLVREILNLNHT